MSSSGIATPRRSGGWWRRAANLLLLAAGAGVALLLAEGGLRLAAHRVMGAGEWLEVGRVFDRSDPILGFSLLPGASRILASGGAYVQRERINSDGLRDIDRPREAPTKGAPLLVLGDSFVYGQGVALPDCLTRKLASRVGGLDVINGGVPGYDLGQSYLNYRSKLRRYHARTVLLGFFMNDLIAAREVIGIDDEKGIPLRYERRAEVKDRESRGLPQGAIGALSEWFRSHSIVYVLVRSRLDQIQARGERGSSTGEGSTSRDSTRAYRATFEAGDPGAPGPEWLRAFRILDALKDAVASDGARFAVFVIPAAWQTSSARWEAWAGTAEAAAAMMDRTAPQKRLAGWCGRTATPCLDLMEVFEESSEGLIFPNDLHWTPEGTARAAEQLATFLRRENLL